MEAGEVMVAGKAVVAVVVRVEGTERQGVMDKQAEAVRKAGVAMEEEGAAVDLVVEAGAAVVDWEVGVVEAVEKVEVGTVAAVMEMMGVEMEGGGGLGEVVVARAAAVKAEVDSVADSEVAGKSEWVVG
ncbi:hypothetical protein CYMTET_32001 [Cymbomonas tetramitiformis]|uniref:Uncharacterized protein n=1 Tax=Cymbomonas tetramitiformis TaxID=36881 RepID=A0AAE0KSD3_9CHLO|nr:hypothetical protein CYMTET_32001 [Cymbomonas tetramitiformis]